MTEQEAKQAAAQAWSNKTMMLGRQQAEINNLKKFHRAELRPMNKIVGASLRAVATAAREAFKALAAVPATKIGGEPDDKS